jgi:hypothetical protein
MTRTLKSLESHAKLEAQRAKQSHDFEYEVENRLNLRYNFSPSTSAVGLFLFAALFPSFIACFFFLFS